MEERTAFRTCPFCEATCGLAVTVRDDGVVKVRGDADDVFSHGFLCPKGVALQDLHEDPDRLRTPLVRDAGGELRPASWDEALGVIAERLPPLLEAHGRDAVAVYIGNPAAHGLAALLYGRVLLKALGSEEHLLGQHGRPAAEGDLLRADVRHRRSPCRSRTSTARCTC